MFEYGNQRRDPVRIAIYCGAGALGLVSGLYPHFLIGYMARHIFLRVIDLYSFRSGVSEAHVKESWFWKSCFARGFNPSAVVGRSVVPGFEVPRTCSRRVPNISYGVVLLPPE